MNQKEYDRRKYEKAKPAYAALMKFYPLMIENLDGEIWRTVPDYENYQISNFGRVKSLWKSKAKILKPAFCNGYLRVDLCKDGKQKLFRVHRLIAQAFIPNPEGKPQVNHKDGHPMNNYVENLEWATHEENLKHAFDTGLKIAPQGEESILAKLTNEQAKYIRNNPDRLNLEQLAAKFGVDRSTIGLIQRGETYKNTGGNIRDKIDNRTPDDIRAKIRAEYKKGVVGCGSYALAKKYGVDHSTILKIVKNP